MCAGGGLGKRSALPYVTGLLQPPARGLAVVY